MAREAPPEAQSGVRWNSTAWLRSTLTAPDSVEDCRDLLERRIHKSSGLSGQVDARVSGSSFAGVMRLASSTVDDAVESLLFAPAHAKPEGGGRAKVTFSGELHSDGAGTRIELFAQQRRSLWRGGMVAVLGGAIGGAAGATTMFATILLIGVVASEVWGAVPPDKAAFRDAFVWLIVACTIVEVVLIQGDLVYVIAWPVVYLAAGVAVLAPAADWPGLWRDQAFRLHATTTAVAVVATLVAARLVGPLGTGQDLNSAVEAVTTPAIGIAVAAMFCARFVLVTAGHLLVPASWLVAVLGATEGERRSNVTAGDAVWAPWRWLAAFWVLGYGIGVAVGLTGYRTDHGEFAIAALAAGVFGILSYLMIFAWLPVYNLLWDGRSVARRVLLVTAVPSALAAPPLVARHVGTGVAGAVFGWAAVIAGVLAVVSAVGGFSETRDLVTARSWRVVRGRVLVAEVRVEKHGMRTFHKPRVEFSYGVAGQDLVGDEVAFYQKAYSRADKAQSRLDRVAPAEEVDVYVDPRDPRKAVLDPRGSADAWIMAVALVGLSGFFACVTAVLVRWLLGWF